MGQRAVESALGKLATDAAFRRRFFRNPATESFRAGLELSPAELDALTRLPAEALTRFSQALDDRIRRLPVGGDQGSVSADGLEAEAGASPVESRPGIRATRRTRRLRVG